MTNSIITPNQLPLNVYAQIYAAFDPDAGLSLDEAHISTDWQEILTQTRSDLPDLKEALPQTPCNHSVNFTPENEHDQDDENDGDGEENDRDDEEEGQAGYSEGVSLQILGPLHTMNDPYLVSYAAMTEADYGDVYIGEPELAEGPTEARELARTRLVQNADIDAGHGSDGEVS